MESTPQNILTVFSQQHKFSSMVSQSPEVVWLSCQSHNIRDLKFIKKAMKCKKGIDL